MPIEELEQEAKSAEVALAAARDPDVSVSSANPHQTVWNPAGNMLERNKIRTNAAVAQRKLSSRRSLIYSYVLRRNHELRFSGIADDIFSRIREKVDAHIGQNVPTAERVSVVAVVLGALSRSSFVVPFNHYALGSLPSEAQPGVRAELRQNAGEARSTLR